MKYRKKPVVIDAYQYAGGSVEPGVPEDWMSKFIKSPDGEYLLIPTLEGSMRANKGDFIIKGINGEFYPCKAEIFYKTYEKVEE